MRHYLCGVERVKRFVNVHLHCIVSNLQKIGKMWKLPPVENFLRTPMHPKSNKIFRHLQFRPCKLDAESKIRWIVKSTGRMVKRMVNTKTETLMCHATGFILA